MVEVRIKPSDIKRIRIYNSRPNINVVYKEYVPSSLFKLTSEVKEGFYYTNVYCDDTLVIDTPTNCYYDDNKCYHLPHCDICVDGNTFTKYFQTLDDVKEYVDSLEKESGINFIKVVI